MADKEEKKQTAEAPVETMDVEAIVEKWMNDHIHNSPVSRNVEAINAVREALPKLISALKN
jgi:hypothetical protein